MSSTFDRPTTSIPLPQLTGIDAATLMRAIAQSHPQWHGFWLHDDGADVIGVLPRQLWTLTNDTGSLVCLQQLRTGLNYQHHHAPCDYTHYQNMLIDYHQSQQSQSVQWQTSSHYQHGLMGYISYDIGAHALNPSITLAERTLAHFGHYDIYLLKNSQTHVWTWHMSCDITSTDKHRLSIHIQQALHTLIDQLTSSANSLGTLTAITVTPVWQQNDYQAAFKATQAYLRAGDAYQINLTQCFSGHTSTASAPLLAHLPTLYQATQAPFCGYLAVANEEILSVSPELFFNFQRSKAGTLLTTKPIKGTRPRGDTAEADAALKHALATSEKDLAENVMIVDLLRNDLGRYAQFGAITVPIRFAIESFSNVHHMVSTVQATLAEDIPALKVLFDSLPAGSITGSPKKRACELIHTLESQPRGAYCGSMGYLNFNDTGQWNVLIRTLQAYTNSNHNHRDSHLWQVEVWAGGGITVLSDCTEEYQECLDKISHITNILAMSPVP